MTITELADAVGGIPRGRSDAVFDGAGIDSRVLREGQLFVALRAERDGHEFVAAAAQHRAGAALVDQPVDVDLPQVIVADTELALARAGAAARQRLDSSTQVIGITGSVGKTTTKDLLAAMLSSVMPIGASARSFNNELGVPITLLEAPDAAGAVVVEMGARGVGHISTLCEQARPQIGIVTRVAAAHTEMFGSIDQVAEAKGELVAALPAAGTAVLNADDPLVAAMVGRTGAASVTYGEAGDVRAVDVEVDELLRPSFRMTSPWGDTSVRLPIAGRHNIGNALAAATAAMAIGMTPDDVASAISSAEVSPWRMELHRAPSGALVLNDAYNANPTSTAAALRSLAELPATRKFAVLGVMAELGDEARAMHVQIIDLANELGIGVMAVGTEEYGVVPASIEGVVAALSDLDSDSAVLIKGSRVAGLEVVAERLLQPQ
jgi:UDP-N-acetylmuramoyl-tripeptide--D-alanyl-D-alanine ligase